MRIFKRKENCFVIPLDHEGVLTPRPAEFLYSAVAERLDRDADATAAFFLNILAKMNCAALDTVTREKEDELSPFWNNGFFCEGDARALFAVVATCKPKTYLEIGSGNSTKFASLAARSENLDTRIISIDPAPRSEIDPLCSEVIRENVLDCSLQYFRDLKAGDILFCDGSHLVLNGSDAVRFWLEIFPSLAPGVLIHIHDIFLPHEYISEFLARGYGEQYLLATALLNNTDIETLLPVFHLHRAGRFPLGGGSFWFRKSHG